MSEDEFSVRPSVLVGETADTGLYRGVTILRNERINPTAVVEFVSNREGVVCGVREVKSLLLKILPEANREVWALDDGLQMSNGEVVLRVKAPYSSFGLYETALCGILAQCSGWATASRECVKAAGGIPVISNNGNRVHPNVAGIMDYSAIIGGCVSGTTSQGAKLSGTNAVGIISASVSLIMGGPVNAMRSLDQHTPQDVSRIAPVNVINDENHEALDLARVLGQKLRAVEVREPSSDWSATLKLVRELRSRLDLDGYSHVEIFLSGSLTPQVIASLVSNQAPINAFQVTGYIGEASPIGFSATIHETDGKAKSIRGTIPGVTVNDRLAEII